MQQFRTIVAAACALLALGGCAIGGARALQTEAEAQSACLSMQTSGPDAEEIRRLENRGAQSNVDGWSLEEARDFFAPEWISVGPDGAHSDLAAVLDGFENGRSRPWAGRFDILDLDIRVYCDSAIVVGKAAAYRIGASGPNDAPAVHFRWLNVWRKQDGRWLYVANQFARY
jgi:hypothetical protein